MVTDWPELFCHWLLRICPQTLLYHPYTVRKLFIIVCQHAWCRTMWITAAVLTSAIAPVFRFLEWCFDGCYQVNSSTDVILHSDALGTFGYITWWNSQWLHFAWLEGLSHWSTVVKELLPIVMASMLRGGIYIQAFCDSEAVVSVLNAGCCKDALMMYLLRSLFFISVFYWFSLKASHIPTGDSECGGRCNFEK